MSSVWTVKPEEVTLDGLTFTDEAGNTHQFWVKVRKRLNAGESRHVMTAGWRGVSGQQRGTDQAPAETSINIDWLKQGFARVVTYLTDWSLEDDGRKKLPLNPDTIASLHEDVFQAIEDAITKHVDATAAEKKVTSGDSVPSAT